MSESVDEEMGNTHPLNNTSTPPPLSPPTHSLTNSSTHLLKVNETLVEKLLVLVKMLGETKGMRIFKRGLKKAAKLLEAGEETGVFVWAPSLKKWLKDPDYIFWLGTVRMA